ncbi:MAG: glycine cleavage system protein GcvH [Halothiobacillaceae bacterium]
MIPQDLSYGRTHEWYRIEPTGELLLGVTDHGQELLGDLVYVELPKPGSRVVRGESCAVLESVKAASDVQCPVDGEVVAVNANLSDEPALVNDDAFGDGWLLRIRPEGDPDPWMSAAEYETHIEG